MADPSTTNTGKLVNGSFALAQPLQVNASSPAGTGCALAPRSAIAIWTAVGLFVAVRRFRREP